MSQAVMDEVAPAPASALPLGPPAAASALGPRWLPPLVLISAVAAGISVYAWFWQHSLDLWWSMGHDRHTHYLFGLNLAFDLCTGDFGRLFHDFDRMRVWGPLHPV